MSKTSEMTFIVKELRDHAAALNDTADWLANVFLATDDDKPPTPTHTIDEVRSILVEKSRDGRSAQVRELLGKYGASKLSEINPEDYEALIKDAEVI